MYFTDYELGVYLSENGISNVGIGTIYGEKTMQLGKEKNIWI